MGILIISHLDEVVKLLKTLLKDAGFDSLLFARSSQETFDILDVEKKRAALLSIDLMIVDMDLPDPGGLGICRIVKTKERFKDLPIIVISANDCVANLTAAFSLGAIDYINSPLNPVETLARIRTALRLKQEIDTRKAREHELLEVTRNLAAANQTLRQMAFLDGLTGIANRRYFDELLQKEWRRAIRTKKAMVLIMLDIDHFKTYNDLYGHQDGDDCLKQVATTLENTLKRPGDHAIRYGGEEFAVILTENIDDNGALTVAESLRTNIAALGIEHSGSPTADHVTLSIGVALAYPDSSSSPEVLLAAADQALYEAKKNGRNQVKAAEELAQRV